MVLGTENNKTIVNIAPEEKREKYLQKEDQGESP